MGLISAQSNSLASLRVTSDQLGLISDNIANANNPNYSRKISYNYDTYSNESGSSVNRGSVQRQLDKDLQKLVLGLTGSTAAGEMRLRYAEWMDGLFGTMNNGENVSDYYDRFEQTLTNLEASPESATAQTEVITSASTLVEALNQGADRVIDLFQTVENEISNVVEGLNSKLSSFVDINRAVGQAQDGSAAKAQALDDRDALISEIAAIIPVKVIDQGNDGVVLTTKSGFSLFDGTAVNFSYKQRSVEQAGALYNSPSGLSQEGKLIINGTSDISDLGSNVAYSLGKGQLSALFTVRDEVLPRALAQFDDIAHSMATAMNSKETEGVAVSDVVGDGFDLDTSDMESGNRITIRYTENSISKSITLVRVDSDSALPIEEEVTGGNHQVVGLNFANGLDDVASQLSALSGGALNFSNEGSGVLRVLDDGSADTVEINNAKVRTTIKGLVNEGTGLSLFVDSNDQAYTDSREGIPQRLGFASRMKLNEQIINDPSRLVIYQDDTTGTTLSGDKTRPEDLLTRMKNLTAEVMPESGLSRYISSNSTSVKGLISSAINDNSQAIAETRRQAKTQTATYETFASQFDESKAVNMDDELAMLSKLEQHYAVNARVLKVIEEMFSIMLETL